jgi:pimeloyl-ACP methyl ester carboxylesterase
VAFPKIDYKQWMSKTSAIGRRRSPHLMALDKCIEEYESEPFTDRKAMALKRLKVALDNWKGTQGPGDGWKKSVRNRTKQVELLTALVEKGRDTDLAPDFMHANLENSRLGVVYLLSHMKVNPKIFNVVLEGGLAVEAASDVIDEISGLDVVGLLGAYEGPVWLINGARDHFRIHEQRFLEACVDGRLLVVPRAGHLVSLDRAEEFTKLVADAADVVAARSAALGEASQVNRGRQATPSRSIGCSCRFGFADLRLRPAQGLR